MEGVFDGSHPDVFSLGTNNNNNNNNNKGFRQTHYNYSGNMFRPYCVIIRPSL